jgi:hypothetical protein
LEGRVNAVLSATGAGEEIASWTARQVERHPEGVQSSDLVIARASSGPDPEHAASGKSTGATVPEVDADAIPRRGEGNAVVPGGAGNQESAVRLQRDADLP